MVARERVRNGEITESHLARLVGISQSHIHNVLKGARKLSPELSDRILQQLHLTTEDLRREDLAIEPAAFRSVPLLSGELGEEMERFAPTQTAGTALVPVPVAAPVFRPLAARLGEDALASPRFESGDLVLIDQSVAARRHILPEAAYLVNTPEGPRLRSLRSAPGHLFVVTGQTLRLPRKWESTSVSRSTAMLVVLGRVVWLSRQLMARMPD